MNTKKLYRIALIFLGAVCIAALGFVLQFMFPVRIGNIHLFAFAGGCAVGPWVIWASKDFPK